MIRPILACHNPYTTAQILVKAGWKLDFSQSPESGDPLVGVSLYGNALLLGITEGCVTTKEEAHLGCGVVLYLTVPYEKLSEIHRQHMFLQPTDIVSQPWGDVTFEVRVEEYRLMIAGI